MTEIVSVASTPADPPNEDGLTDEQIADALTALRVNNSRRENIHFNMFGTAHERRAYLGRLFKLNNIINKKVTFEVNLLDVAESISYVPGRDQTYIINLINSFDFKAFVEGFDLASVVETYEEENVCVECGRLLLNDDELRNMVCDPCMASWADDAEVERAAQMEDVPVYDPEL